jgi:hypothetical protein
MLGTDLSVVDQMKMKPTLNQPVVVPARHPHDPVQLLRTEVQSTRRRPIRQGPPKALASLPLRYPILIFTLGECPYPISRSSIDFSSQIVVAFFADDFDLVLDCTHIGIHVH